MIKGTLTHVNVPKSRFGASLSFPVTRHSTRKERRGDQSSRWIVVAAQETAGLCHAGRPRRKQEHLNKRTKAERSGEYCELAKTSAAQKVTRRSVGITKRRWKRYTNGMMFRRASWMKAVLDGAQMISTGYVEHVQLVQSS